MANEIKLAGERELAGACLMRWWEVARCVERWWREAETLEPTLGPPHPLADVNGEITESAHDFAKRFARGLIALGKAPD